MALRPPSPSPADVDRSIVAGVDVDRLVEEYETRNIDRLPDATLVALVSEVVATPRREKANSFVLHAPLELAARAALLPLVEPDRRRLARIRVLAIAAQYDEHEPLDGTEPTPSDDTAPDAGPRPGPPIQEAADALRTALGAGDIDDAGLAAGSLARATTGRGLADVLAGDLLPLTAAAAHAPIFLFHMAHRDSTSGLSPHLLIPLARELARNPTWRIRWLDDRRPAEPTDPDRLRAALTGVPLLGPPGSTFIHPQLMQVDEGGVAERHLGSVVGSRTPEAETELLRIAAGLMLTDTPEQGPYGWTHCLTIPQAVRG
ncbi:MAG: hypothetical protein ACR2QK_16850, partial [Acidimicrobiales bacterium]